MVFVPHHLNISCNTIKVLEENIGRKISDIPHSNILTGTSPKARDINERINKWDLIKMLCLLALMTYILKKETKIFGVEEVGKERY